MVDFARLNTPEGKARAAQARLDYQRAMKDVVARLSADVEYCHDRIDQLDGREAEFVADIRHKVSIFGTLSAAQKLWLGDIKLRLETAEIEEEAPRSRFASLCVSR